MDGCIPCVHLSYEVYVMLTLCTLRYTLCTSAVHMVYLKQCYSSEQTTYHGITFAVHVEALSLRTPCNRVVNVYSLQDVHDKTVFVTEPAGVNIFSC